jgi:hypothetical protein
MNTNTNKRYVICSGCIGGWCKGIDKDGVEFECVPDLFLIEGFEFEEVDQEQNSTRKDQGEEHV